MASYLYKETEQLTQAINDYYDGKDAFPDFPIAKTEAYEKLTALPNVKAMEMADGSVGDYVYTSAQSGANSENIGDIADSNNQISASDSYDIQIPSTAEDYTGDTMAIKSAIGLGKAAGGLVKYHGGTIKTVSFAVASVLVANLLGKIIGSSLYTDDPALFSYNQIKKTMGDSWNDGLATKDGKAPVYYLVDKFGNLKTYIQKELIPALTFYEGGPQKLFTAHASAIDKENIADSVKQYFPNGVHANVAGHVYIKTADAQHYFDTMVIDNPNIVYAVLTTYGGGTSADEGLFSYYSIQPFTVKTDRYDNDKLSSTSTRTANTPKTTRKGTTFYSFDYGYGFNTPGWTIDPNIITVSTLPRSSNRIITDTATALFNSSGEPALEYKSGISTQPNTNYITDSDIGDNVNDTLNNLVTKYPDTFSDDNTITKHVVQKDGTIKDIKLVQVPYPVYTGTDENPVTDGVTDYVSQTTPAPSASTLPDDLLKLINDGLGNRGTSINTPSVGGGTTPTVTTPTQSATALWTIYNPTKEQLDSFGAYLWSTNFLENVKKLMSDPMQAVIGLKSVFMRPKRGESATIKVGFSDSGVSSVTVPDQYNNLNCGSVDIPEYFGNVLDYAPYTKISLYLPFIGIVQLNPADVLRSTVTVEYKGDVLTGACIAEIAVKRDNAGGILYQYSGNMACDYPLTSGNYTAVISAGLNAAGSAIGGAMVGGVPGALIAGGRSALSSLANGNLFNVQQSGGFSGASGVLGGKRPYLIISRPQPEINDHFPELQGYGSNKYVTLSECTGYTRVKAVHVDKIEKATSAEKDMIEEALKSGVIFK